MKCKECKFWQSRWDYLEYSGDDESEGLERGTKYCYQQIGQCRRFPPVYISPDESVRGFDSFDGDASDFFEFPVTRSDMWCGEFASASQQPKSKEPLSKS